MMARWGEREECYIDGESERKGVTAAVSSSVSNEILQRTI